MGGPLTELLFPRKCVLCGRILSKDETDLCRGCRTDAPESAPGIRKVPYLATCISIWYYEGAVRESLLRFKFGIARSYASAYGRMLALRIQEELEPEESLLTWVPVSWQRRFRRGYDQVQLLADAVGKELGIRPVKLLRKIRNNPPQSGISEAAQRRANVLGAYTVRNPEAVAGKKIILLDDILTTGATVSECARVLLTAGAQEIVCATVAAVHHSNQKNQ